MGRHGGMPVEAIHEALVFSEMVAEGGVASKLRLCGEHGNRPLTKHLHPELDHAPDASDRWRRIECRTDLVLDQVGG